MDFGKDLVYVEVLPIIVLSCRQLLIMQSVTNYTQLKRNCDLVSVCPSVYKRTFAPNLLNKFM